MGKKKAYKPAPPDGWTKLPNAILEDGRLKDQHVRVYAAIRSIAGENGTCWATTENIGKRAGGKGKRAVQSIVSELVAFGLIVIEPRHDVTTGRQYRIVDAPPEKTPREISRGGAQNSTREEREISRGGAQNSAHYLRTSDQESFQEERAIQTTLSTPPSGDRSGGRDGGGSRPTKGKREPGKRTYATHQFVPLSEDRHPPTATAIEKARYFLPMMELSPKEEEPWVIGQARLSEFDWCDDCDELAYRVACLFGDMPNVDYYAEAARDCAETREGWTAFIDAVYNVWGRFKGGAGTVGNPGAYFEKTLPTMVRFHLKYAEPMTVKEVDPKPIEQERQAEAEPEDEQERLRKEAERVERDAAAVKATEEEQARAEEARRTERQRAERMEAERIQRETEEAERIAERAKLLAEYKRSPSRIWNDADLLYKVQVALVEAGEKTGPSVTGIMQRRSELEKATKASAEPKAGSRTDGA